MVKRFVVQPRRGNAVCVAALVIAVCMGLFMTGLCVRAALAAAPLALPNTLENIAQAGGAYTPVITSSAPDPTNLASMPIVVHWGGAMTGFTESDLVLGNATLANFRTGGELYSYVFDLLPSSEGLVTVDIPAAVAVDESLQNNLAAVQFTHTFYVRATPPPAPQTAFKSLSNSGFMYIPFTQYWAVSQDIYTINTDGTGLTALTSTPENQCYPTWSPDGSKIAFARRKGGHCVISVMNADGSNVHDLFEPDLKQSIENVECTPAWSPDGAQIAFTSSRDGNLEIYIMNTDGTKPRNLTNNPAADGFPAWSPGGSEIAFTSDRDGHMQIYACGLDGSNVQRLTDDPLTDDFAPSWSPDGKQILVTARNRNEFGREDRIDIFDVGKPDVEKMVMRVASGTFGAWSPKGRRVAMTVFENGPPRVNLLDIDTKAQVSILPEKEVLATLMSDSLTPWKNVRCYTVPQWSPDGTKLVFTSAPQPDDVWTVRWLYLGAHGELFAPQFNAVGDYNDLLIAPLDGGFALVYSPPKEGTYAIVRKDCKILLIPPVPKEVDRTSAAEFWPYRDGAGLPIVPSPDAVIAAKHAVSPPGIVPPEGTLGWMFLRPNGRFWTPVPGTPIHANTLWVVRKGEGLEFIHTGPTSKGKIYATVAPTGEMTVVSDPDPGYPRCWKIVDETGRPTFSPPGMSGPGRCGGVKLTVYPDGATSLPGIPTP